MPIRQRAIQYHVILYSPDGSGGPGLPKLELTPHVLNITTQSSMNLPDVCAFTLARDSQVLAQINWMVDHIKVFRETPAGLDTFFAGKIVQPQYSALDAIVTAWDYKALLQLSRTGFNVLYPEKLIGTEILSPEWVLAKNEADSVLAFVTTGTIEDPLGQDTITPIKSNAEFGVKLFNRLFTFFMLAEIGMANTTNTCLFEITPESPHTFNFWKNYGTIKPVSFTSPGNLTSHGYDPQFGQLRNDRATVVINETTGAEEVYTVTDGPSIAIYRRLQDAIAPRTLIGASGGTTESDQVKAVIARMLVEGIRLPKSVAIWPRQGEFNPLRDARIGDRVYVTLRNDQGGDLFAGTPRLVGWAIAWSPYAGEVQQLLVRGVD